MASHKSSSSGALPSAAQAAIDEKIRSMDYNECQTKIKTIDAQESLDGGVIVLVTGYLVGKDFVKKDFTQTFFLATQDNENSYYVLNDIFRYVEDTDLQQEEQEFTHEVDALDSAEHDSLPSQEEHIIQKTAAPSEEDENYNPSELEEGSAVEDEDFVEEVINEVPIKEVINEVLVDEVINEVQVEEVINEVPVEVVINEVPVTEVINEVPAEEVINEVRTGSQALLADSGLSTGQEHKKSYASILKAMKDKSSPVSVPTSAPVRVAPVYIERNVVTSVPSAPVLPAASEVTAASSNDAESSNAHDSEADGYSIYIKNLPLNATPAQLEEEFKKFGPIKPNGIQVRSNKLQGFCFGFVEFDAADALQSAIQASPIMIGNRQAYVEEKRTTTTGSRGNNRGRFLPGRGGFRGGDGVRGRGRGYGRGDYGYRADFGSRGGGRSGSPAYSQGDQGYQRVDHMSSNYERRSRPGSPPSRSNAAPRVPTST